MHRLSFELFAFYCQKIIIEMDSSVKIHSSLSAKFALFCCCYRHEICSELMAIISAYCFTKLDNDSILYALRMWIGFPVRDRFITERRECISIFGRISDWDTSEVTNMKGLFKSAKAFNDDISNWETSNVIDMSGMFDDATNFNQPLDRWDVSNVKDMSCMFASASSFNQPLEKWNMSNVIKMDSMFDRACSFNQPLEKWNLINVNKTHIL